MTLDLEKHLKFAGDGSVTKSVACELLRVMKGELSEFLIYKVLLDLGSTN